MFKRITLGGGHRRISVTTKIALALSLLLLFVIVTTGTSSFFREHNMLHQEYEKRGTEISSTVALLANEYITFGQYDYFKTLLQKLESYGNIDYIIITDTDGKVLLTTDTRPEAEKVSSQKEYEFTTPIKPFGGNTIGYVQLGLNTAELDNLPLEMAINWGLLSLAAILASIFLANVLTKRILQKPLLELTAGTEHVAVGDFSSRVNIPQRDELGELGDCFNNMSFQVGNLIQSVNVSILDIQKGMEQLAGSLQAVEHTNSSLLRNLSILKGNSGGHLSEMAQSTSLAEQLISLCRQINELQKENITLTDNAIQAGEKEADFISEAATELDSYSKGLAEYRTIQLALLNKGESWSESIANLASLNEHLSSFVVEVALEAARSGNTKLTTAAENLNQSIQNTCNHLTKLQQELTELTNAGKSTLATLENSMGHLGLLQEKIAIAATSQIEHKQLLQNKQELESEIGSQLEGVDTVAGTLIRGLSANLTGLNNLLQDNLGPNGRLQITDMQTIHTPVKKLLRLTERLKALAIQYKT